MLAEHEGPGYFMEKGFDMNYAWELHHLMNNIAQGKDSVRAIDKYFKREWAVYPNFAFYRQKDENQVLVFLNFTKRNVSFKPVLKNLEGGYAEYFSGTKTTLPLSENITLEPWSFKVYIK